MLSLLQQCNTTSKKEWQATKQKLWTRDSYQGFENVRKENNIGLATLVLWNFTETSLVVEGGENVAFVRFSVMHFRPLHLLGDDFNLLNIVLIAQHFIWNKCSLFVLREFNVGQRCKFVSHSLMTELWFSCWMFQECQPQALFTHQGKLQLPKQPPFYRKRAALFALKFIANAANTGLADATWPANLKPLFPWGTEHCSSATC